jgi:uncharacterized protein
MSTNQGPEYFAAEKHYLQAKTTEEKIFWLKEMLHGFKKHKGSENMQADLKRRLIKFEDKAEKAKKTGKTTKKGVKKEGFQCVIIGPPNTGKSTLLSKLTNAKPKISPNPFTTYEPEIGAMYYQGIQSQIVDLPSIGSENFDIGIIHTADLLLIVIDNLAQLKEIEPLLVRATKKRIVVINKSDLLSEEQIRKLEETIKSKKIAGILISCLTNYNIETLKERIIQNSNYIRIYTKEPGKQPSKFPVALPPNSTVKDVAESIRNGFSKTVKESRVTGPSSKFPNQKVGLTHTLKDLDIVEFKTI